MVHPKQTDLALTDDERALFDAIRFEGTGHDSYEVAKQNGERAAVLAESLIRRKAIPDVRLRYFTDAELNPGVSKSRRQVFIDNGTAGRAILSHGNFLKYLRYFLCGPQLPLDVMAAFREIAGDPMHEREDLRKLVRAQVRALGDDGLGEEFFKLALECGLDVYDAKTLRTDAMNAHSAARRARRRR